MQDPSESTGERPPVWETYITSLEDTLAGIALSRNTTIREIKKVNKLWSDTLWPGQKLSVPPRRASSATEKEKPLRAVSMPAVSSRHQQVSA